MTHFTEILLISTLVAGTSARDVVIGILGNSVSIDCRLTVTKNVVWDTLSGGLIAVDQELVATETSKYSVESYTGTRETLVIHNVTLTDETEYRCYDMQHETDAYVTKLNVLVRPWYMNITYPTSPVLEGDDVILICEADGGKPLPELSWHKEDGDGTTTNMKGLESRTDYRNGTGYIASVLKLKATRDILTKPFFCNISVPVFYKESISANIDVYFSLQTPVINGYGGSFDENSLVRLDCISAGNHPAPTVFWLLNGTRVSDTEYAISPEINHTTTVTSYLTRRLSRDYDGSTLTCVVTNFVMVSKGMEPATTNITLRMSYKPNVTIVSKEYTVQEGRNITIQCEIDALPVPDLSIVFWTHEGKMVNKDRYELLNNGTLLKLHLTNVSRAHGGTYACHVANHIGTSSDKARLNVTYAPQCSMDGTKRVPAKIGSTVRLDCKMYTNPTSVMLIWRNRSTQKTISSFPAVVDKHEEEMVTGSIDFEITDVSQYTTIECIGTNTEIGPIRPCVYKIEQPSPAEAPRNCTVQTSDDHVTVTCISGFDGGSRQTFILQTKFQNTFETISYRSEPEFNFATKKNVTVRVCSMNEDFKDVHKCSSLLTATVFLKDKQGDEPVEAREDKSALYITVGITIFTSVLVITAIVILLLRNRRKTTNSRTSPIAEVISSRRNLQHRMNFGGKLWNKIKHTKTVIPRDTFTPTSQRQSSEGIQIICSTPYCINKQPDLQEVGNSPILPENGNDLNTSPRSNILNSNSESTGFVLSPLLYSCQGHECRDKEYKTLYKGCLQSQNMAFNNKNNYNVTINHTTTDDAKSIDLLAVTLYKDYTAGDIADVLDQTEHDSNGQSNTYKRFGLHTHMSNFVVNGTTLSFDVDYSESDFYGTMSEISSPITNSSENRETECTEDHLSNHSNSVPSIGGSSGHTSDSSEVKTIMDQTFTVTQIQNNSSGTSNTEELELIDPYSKRESYSSSHTCLVSAEDHVVDINFDNSVSDAEEYTNSERTDVSNCNATLCDIDQYTLVITDESSMYSAGKSFNLSNTSNTYNFGNTTRSSGSCAHRNDSFRTALDNSTVTRTSTTDINETETYINEEDHSVVKAPPVNIVDETFQRPLSVASGDNFVEESTLNLTTVINDVKNRTLALI